METSFWCVRLLRLLKPHALHNTSPLEPRRHKGVSVDLQIEHSRIIRGPSAGSVVCFATSSTGRFCLWARKYSPHALQLYLFRPGLLGARRQNGVMVVLQLEQDLGERPTSVEGSRRSNLARHCVKSAGRLATKSSEACSLVKVIHRFISSGTCVVVIVLEGEASVSGGKFDPEEVSSSGALRFRKAAQSSFIWWRCA